MMYGLTASLLGLTGSVSIWGLDKSLDLMIQEIVASNPYQLSINEYTYIAEVIQQNAPSNVLVFGLGNDSILWHRINAAGKTVFLEHNPQWHQKILTKFPFLTCYFVQYHTKLSDWKMLLDRIPIDLAIDLPS